MTLVWGNENLLRDLFLRNVVLRIGKKKKTKKKKMSYYVSLLIAIRRN